MKTLIITEDNKRIDTVLAKLLENKSRSEIQQFIDQEKITIDGKKIKASLKTKCGMCVQIEEETPIVDSVVATKMELNIVYEDEYLLVINKPQGLVVHPGAGHRDDTLVNGLLNYLGEKQLSQINGDKRPGIVHRIDKDTSGLLVVAKDNETHKKLSKLLEKHEIERTYIALVHGIIQEKSGTIIAPIGRDSNDRQKMAVKRDGKEATTHFVVLARSTKFSLLQLELETGRTHQIRVHMKYIKHPVVGDPLYAQGKNMYGLNGQALHATKLKFIHPILNSELEFEVGIPNWFQTLIDDCQLAYE